jgi:hypothetical protein
MKAYWGSGGVAPPFLNLALVNEWLTSRPCRFTPRYPLDRRLGWPQIRSERCGEVKKLAPPGIRTRAVLHVVCLNTHRAIRAP